MKRTGVLIWCLILCGFFTAHSTIAQEVKSKEIASNEISKLIGNWSGESICVNKEKFPGCHDEQVIYRIVAASGKSDTVTITMDKIVDGKPETMAVANYVYDAQKQMLTSEYKNTRVHLIIELAVKGNLIEGTVAALPDRTLVRRIKLKKDE